MYNFKVVGLETNLGLVILLTTMSC